jgi:hypothetical protein
VSPGDSRTVQAVGEAFGSGGEYHPVDPVRILDTRQRSLDVEPFGRKGTGNDPGGPTFDVPIVGRGGLPTPVDRDGDGFDDNVLAVAVNITIVNPTGSGYLKAYGTGEQPGTSSIVNFRPGEVVPNSAVLRPGRDGELTVQVATPGVSGSVDVLIDVFGWFSSSGYESNGGEFGARLVAPPAGPGRIFDSREASGGSRPFGAAEERRVRIWGADASNPTVADIVPNDPDVVGVLLNITGVNNLGGSRATFYSLKPGPTPAGTAPSTSNMNLLAGKFRSNLAIVPLSASGDVYVYNLAGQSHIILDVVGYLVKNEPPTSCRGRVIPLVAPFRAFDTRESAFFQQPLPPANAEDWSFQAFANDVKIGSSPVGPQVGLIGNLTAAGLGRRIAWEPVSSFLTAYPTPAGPGTQLPTVSNLVVAEGEVVPNMAFLTYGSNGSDPYQIRFYNHNGFLDYLLDVTAVVLDDCAS